MNDFSQLNLSSVLRANIAKLGFVSPTPVQAQAIEPALAGRDVVATAQTGTGKTLAFALPLLESLLAAPKAPGLQALVLSPTRELAIQIQEAIKQVAAGTGVATSLAVGGMGEHQQLMAIRKARILIATPGRLCDFLDRKLVKLAAVRTVVLDEADRMLDMGFLPALSAILKHLPAQRQTLLFSATIEKSVAHLVDSYVKNPVRIAIGSAAKPTEQVDLHVYEVEPPAKLDLLSKIIRAESGPVLVFARTKHGTDKLAKRLALAGHKAARIHGGRTQGQRNQALRGFKDGTYRVLVATDVAARGIHVDGVAHVVNYDLPQVPEDFIHRVGRTGRAGARGVASTFRSRAERADFRKIENALRVRMTERAVS